MKNELRECRKWNWVVVFAMMLVSSDSVFAQVAITDTSVSSNINTVWLWVRIVFTLGFFITLLVGAVDVYSKSQGEDKEGFKRSLMNWGKGLLFIVVFFAVVAGLLTAWNNQVNSSMKLPTQ